LCKEVDCGKGTCVGDKSYPLSYKCECQAGWKQTQYDDDDVDDEHKFLPCVIPNCNLLFFLAFFSELHSGTWYMQVAEQDMF